MNDIKTIAQGIPDIDQVTGTLTPPPQLNSYINKGAGGGIGFFLNNFIGLIFVAGVIAALGMLVWGGFSWVTSGGDKEQMASARGRIIHALIGLLVLAITFAILSVIQDFLKIQLFS